MTASAKPKSEASLARDCLHATWMAVGVLGIWGVVWCVVGKQAGKPGDVLDQKVMIGLVAALFSLAGLLSRQYVQSEVYSYLTAQDNLESAIRALRQVARSDAQLRPVENLEALAKTLACHRSYVLTELKMLAALPFALVVLLGTAILTSQRLTVAAVSLAALVWIVCYMVRAAYTSTTLITTRLEIARLTAQAARVHEALAAPAAAADRS